MAEVFGIFTGAISVASLAIQIFDSIQQLREFCSSVRDAPEAISNVLEELEILGETLLQIYQDQKLNRDSVDPSIRRSLTYVDRVAGELQSIMTDLAKGMDGSKKKQKWGAIRVAMKKNSVKDLLTRLERSKSLLSIAIQCSTVQIQFEQRESNALLHSLLTQTAEGRIGNSNDTAVDKVLELSVQLPTDYRTRKPKDVSDDETSQLPAYSAGYRPQYGKATEIFNLQYIWVGLGWYRYRYQSQTKAHKSKLIISNQKQHLSDTDEFIERTFIPFAFTGLNGFSLRKLRNHNNWQYTFTPIRVVPVDSEVFAICASGDVDTLIEHFQEKSATLYDTSSDGWTLLHVAAAYARPEMCSWLIQQGIKSEATTNYTAISSLHAAALASGQMEPWGFLPGMPCQFGNSTEDRADDVTSVIRVLVERGDLDPMVPRKKGQTALHCYTGPSEAFQYMLDHQQHFQVDRSVKNEIGLDIVTWNLSQITTHCFALTRAALGAGPLSKDQVIGSYYIGFGPYQRRYFPDSNSGLTIVHWALWRLSQFAMDRVVRAGITFMSELIDAGADIHARSALGNTPFDYSVGWNYSNPTSTDLWVWSKSDHYNYDGDDNYADHGQDMRPYALEWLRLLRKKGVNLQDYIQAEAVLHKDSGINSMEYLRLGIKRELTVVECIGEEDIMFNVRDVMVEIEADLKLPGSWPSERTYVDELDRDVYLGLKPSADWTFNTLDIVL